MFLLFQHGLKHKESLRGCQRKNNDNSQHAHTEWQLCLCYEQNQPKTRRKISQKNGKKRLIKLLARAFRGTFSLFVLECKHVCLSLFSKKGIVYVVCVVLRCVRVCWEISSSSKSSLWAAITKTATVRCFYYFTLRLCNPFFSCVCLFVCLFALKAISRRAFIKMLFCVTSVFSLHIRSCHHHLYICFFFFGFLHW